jgi:hypothetical protein
VSLLRALPSPISQQAKKEFTRPAHRFLAAVHAVASTAYALRPYRVKPYAHHATVSPSMMHTLTALLYSPISFVHRGKSVRMCTRQSERLGGVHASSYGQKCTGVCVHILIWECTGVRGRDFTDYGL